MKESPKKYHIIIEPLNYYLIIRRYHTLTESVL